ncbi:MAG TPA: GAF domain-containing protein [Anaerolineales bacterium]|nr:GAF domain-containing protein [Anaerolineales bacterium]
MLNSLSKHFTAPVFSDNEEKTRSAGYLNVIVLSNIPILLLFMIVRTVTGAEPFGVDNLILAAIITILTTGWFLMKSGRVGLAAYLHVSTIWLASTMIALSGSGIRGTVFTSYFVVMLMAGLLLGWKPAIGFTILSVAAGFGLVYAENVGIINYIPGPALGVAIEGTVLFLFGAIFLYLIISSLQGAVKRSNANSTELRSTNNQLTELRDALEVRVEDRTRELANRNQDLDQANSQIQRRATQFEALAQVTQAITSIRDLQELLPHITTVISHRFGFYHVGIFLLDDANEFAVLSAANSEGGKRMLERKHRLRVGEQGIVGNVTLTGNPRIAMDVGVDAIFFDNPELPDTHSEMALPLKSGKLVVGALDVQSTERGAFTQEDIQMLSLLADQVSLAIENARLFDETRRALSEAETISHQLTREAWARMPVENKLLGYRYSIAGSSPLNEPLQLTELSKSNRVQNEVSQVTVPIELRGETIGTLVVQSPATAALNQDQIDLIRAVAERVALSAENARLFEETTRRAERERLVSNITGKIRSVNDPQSMIQTAMEELRKALGASKVEVIPQAVKGAE